MSTVIETKTESAYWSDLVQQINEASEEVNKLLQSQAVRADSTLFWSVDEVLQKIHQAFTMAAKGYMRSIKTEYHA